MVVVSFNGFVPSLVVVILAVTAPRRGTHRSSVALPPQFATNEADGLVSLSGNANFPAARAKEGRGDPDGDARR